MADINREDDDHRSGTPPRFNMGERVASRTVIRNDGTYNGKDIGEVLVTKGEIGFVPRSAPSCSSSTSTQWSSSKPGTGWACAPRSCARWTTCPKRCWPSSLGERCRTCARAAYAERITRANDMMNDLPEPVRMGPARDSSG
jgi:hypothetical protein